MNSISETGIYDEFISTLKSLCRIFHYGTNALFVRQMYVIYQWTKKLSHGKWKNDEHNDIAKTAELMYIILYITGDAGTVDPAERLQRRS